MVLLAKRGQWVWGAVMNSTSDFKLKVTVGMWEEIHRLAVSVMLGLGPGTRDKD